MNSLETAFNELIETMKRFNELPLLIKEKINKPLAEIDKRLERIEL
jgi:hypothetical protein